MILQKDVIAYIYSLPLHHDVIENSSKYTANDLGGEGTLWREFGLLSELQVTEEVLTLLQ